MLFANFAGRARISCDAFGIIVRARRRSPQAPCSLVFNVDFFLCPAAEWPRTYLYVRARRRRMHCYTCTLCFKTDHPFGFHYN